MTIEGKKTTGNASIPGYYLLITTIVELQVAAGYKI